MMFGEWGNPDHDESVRIMHRALDAGINFIDTADVYSGRANPKRSSARRCSGGRRDHVVLATKAYAPMGHRPELHRQFAPLAHDGGREQPAGAWAPIGLTSTRSIGPTRPPTSTRRSAP